MNQHSFETPVEDEGLYTPTPVLGDYLNELAGIMIGENELVQLVNKPVHSVEERYAKRREVYTKTYEENPELNRSYFERDEAHLAEIREVIENYPEKIARIDTLADFINSNTDVNKHKQAVNEMIRLIRGKDAKLVHEEPEADPNLLTV